MEIFLQYLQSAIDLCIPKYFPKFQNSKQPYTNHQVIKLKYRKEALWRKYCATGDHLDYHRFTIVRNSLRNLTHQLRSKHENKIASLMKENPKVFWKYVRSKVKIKSGIPTLVETDSEATTDVQKAEAFNRFFSSVFTIENTDNIPHFPDRSFAQSLSDVSITPEDVFTKLTSLKSFKSAGPDNLNPRVLKEAAFELSNPLSLTQKVTR